MPDKIHAGPTTMRLFVAIRLEPAVRDGIQAVRDVLRRQGTYGSFPGPENYHVTLAFLGEHPDFRIVEEALRTVRFGPFRIDLGTLGRFGDTLWVGLERNPALDALAAKVRGALTAGWIPSDPKPFRAHITLARRAVTDGIDLHAVSVPRAGMTVRSFSLMRSQRGERGVIYTELARFDAERSGT